jgi:imidazolonepropionase-like amidohydrolase
MKIKSNMKTMHRIAVILLCMALLLAGSQIMFAASPVPGQMPAGPVALVGGVIHPVSGPELRDAVLIFDQGKIIAVGKDVAIPANAEKIDLKGQHVYPGLIEAHTHLGLVEISSVKATVDQAETGEINPNVKAQVAVNPDSEMIPVTRSSGVLTVLTAPGGGLISGQSAVMQLDGWTWEDMTVKSGVGMHIRWPRMAAIHTWRLDESAESQLANRDKSLRDIRRTIADARAYLAARKAATNGAAAKDAAALPLDSDARWEAMIPVLEGRMPVIIEADEIQQIESAVAFARHEGLKMILLGGYDAAQCSELLKQNSIPVILYGVHRLPQRKDDAYDAPFTVAAKLHQAGIKFCISGNGRMGNIRNLAYHAGTAAAYGLPAEEALKAVTLYPAEILGVADRLGSLAAGKDATLIITDGDPLEITSHVNAAFIGGRPVDLTDRHKQLWQKYQEKYRRQSPDKNAAGK